ncbi:ATP-binding protein [Streptomyces sp. NPDC056264]|uniref:ATP-binding protein n=1 Tax=Streptomyces sp. NPDC056264 TaxID=3345767 RepID=UPI003AABDD38
MTSDNLSPTDTTQLDGVSPHLDRRVFALRFTSTARGARLARRLVAVRLDEWGVSYGTEAHETVVLVAAELATNAVRHGHVPGRDFHLSLRVAVGLARVEVSDTRAERVPPRPGELSGPRPELSDGGRGLLLVDALAERWGWCPRPGAPGKTVWAECALP